MINITNAAAKKIRDIIYEEDPSLKLRVYVQGGGCSGFQYGFTLEDKPQAEDDFAFQKDDVTVLVDAMSMQYLQDAEIDYKTSLMGSEFKIKNPNAKSTCGCGSSFTA